MHIAAVAEQQKRGGEIWKGDEREREREREREKEKKKKQREEKDRVMSERGDNERKKESSKSFNSNQIK